MENNDLISRSKLWKKFDEAHLFDDGNPRHIAQQIVEEAPAVEAVVLPCKVGDTVYFADDLFMWPAEIDGIRIRESGVYFEWVQFAKSPELTEVWDNGDFTYDDIGKTVFFTQDEAEAAFAKMKGGASSD